MNSGPSIITRFIHASLIIMASIPWAIACGLLTISLVLVVLADKLWPNATSGNCWSYTAPKWIYKGGYLLIRPADGIRLFKIGIIPHVLWLKSLSDSNDLEHTFPNHERTTSKWLPWKALYFPYSVHKMEKPHNYDDSF